LLDRYRASLYARALPYLGQPEDAADAVQETFLLALTRQD
jgi:DNA-directed RNA polymerase specialized sigma24 family protein